MTNSRTQQALSDPKYRCSICDKTFDETQELDENGEMIHYIEKTIYKNDVAYDVPVICGPIEEDEKQR